MKEAEGLFRRCILESGSVVGLNPVARYGAGNPEYYMENARQVAADLGASDSAEGVELLRSLPAEKILKGWFFRPDGSYRGNRSDPVLKGLLFDGDFAVDPGSQYINSADLLFGFNSDEGSIFSDKNMTEEAYAERLRNLYGERADEVMSVILWIPVRRLMTAVLKSSDFPLSRPVCCLTQTVSAAWERKYTDIISII